MDRVPWRDLTLEAFVHATESPDKVERAVRLFAPEAKLERRQLGGHFGQGLAVVRAVVREPAAIERSLARVREAVGPQIARSAERRLDPDLNLHVRFDKQAAARGQIALEASAPDDVIQMQLRLRASRRERDKAVALVERVFLGAPPREEE